MNVSPTIELSLSRGTPPAQIRKEYATLLADDASRPQERKLAEDAFKVDQGLHELVAEEVLQRKEAVYALPSSFPHIPPCIPACFLCCTEIA